MVEYVQDYVLNNVHTMLPKIITPTELRQNLAKFLNIAPNEILVIKGKKSNKVILDQTYFNCISGLADQFEIEDPEGEYRPEFVKEILEVAKSGKNDKSVKSLKDLL